MVNYTPESFPGIPPYTPQPRPCGWCVTLHVANIICTCADDCGESHCPMKGQNDRWADAIGPLVLQPVPRFKE